MSQGRKDFEELGAKVQRAQHALAEIRSIGTSGGIRVEVDAENHLLSVSVPDAHEIIEAYNAAVANKRDMVDEAMREVTNDARVEAISTFTRAAAALRDAQRQEQPSWEEHPGNDSHSFWSDRSF
ncbi:YbaB/EbfC family nucleoid-associated protein [Nocardia abscessus]|uniref:YbaB/EbfC family nucleoid-associated protein n=1 Tax=Nocardia abscessus TaxID=120957 RepID=UPI000308F386|nr:YbaB/EbfC family nucleoid-associated protein [Nocardia abscessus]MCC3330923.1 YbaB/EbfC family nucleoid-associated protein [Nocardia abscessus]